MGALPPVARLALVFSGGAALAFLPGRFSLPALLLALGALAPIPASPGPRVRLALVLGVLSGAAAGLAARPEAPPDPPAGWAVRWREALGARVDALYGEQAPVVGALILARREGLDPALREAFARSGTAHLLAISGFHVGVLAGALFALLRGARVGRRRAGLGAALAAWLYVALLGFPDAASRAALILTAVAASRARGRPPARWGGLGAALLALVAGDPARLLSPGFQLSFAGAAGLVAWSRPLRRRLARWPRLPDGVADGVAAGVAATLATLPIVAWHFERVSLVGIPATLAATPLVVVALPGTVLSLLVDAVLPAGGRFLAGGVTLCLEALTWVTTTLADPEWASVWVPRPWVSVGAGGLVASALAARAVRGPARRWVWGAGVAAGIVAWPALLTLQARGTVELVMVDVGQGDAVAVRTPAGRWILVDAGPPWRGDPGGAPVVRALRRRGVVRLEALVLTHPDLDHIGGAAAVLHDFRVLQVLDPARAVGKPEYLALLELASDAGVPWRGARAGEVLALDGVTLEVLHPPTPAPGEDVESNDLSVVLSLRFGDFDALLTGDAPSAVERAVLPRVPADLEVLKVGHHGSATSTGAELLEGAPPEVALVSVGARNRYGHPDPGVLRRLGTAGVEVRRTDREGTLSVLARPDGTFQVRAAGPARR
ncbi:MAG: hypothetical protein AMXMBFR53_35740 [Gemmatimonadota bacterium]